MSDASGAGPLSTEQLFRQHAGFVTRFLARLGVPSSQLDDALQEVFLVVHRHGGYRPGPAKPTSYLAGIALHAATKQRRQQRRELRDEGAALEAIASEARDPRHALETQEGLRRLQAALDRLPEELRVTLILTEIEGESCLSVAAAMGLPVGTVYWRAHEARKKFQAALKQLDAAESRPRAHSAEPAPRRRAVGETAMGMFMFFGASDAEREMRELCALARRAEPSAQWIEQSLAQHQHLVQTGAPLPSWAASAAPQAVSMVSLVGGAGVVSALTAGAAAVMLMVAMSSAPALRTAAEHGAKTGTETQAGAVTAAASASAAAVATATVNVDEGRAATDAAPEAQAVAEAAGATEVARAEAARQRAKPASKRARAGGAEQPAAIEAARAVEPAAAQAPELAGQARELLELQEVAQAERLLATQPARTLALVRGMQQRFPSGYLEEERGYLEVMALLGIGRRDEAHDKAERFLRGHPAGPYSRRVRAALLEADKL